VLEALRVEEESVEVGESWSYSSRGGADADFIRRHSSSSRCDAWIAALPVTALRSDSVAVRSARGERRPEAKGEDGGREAGGGSAIARRRGPLRLVNYSFADDHFCRPSAGCSQSCESGDPLHMLDDVFVLRLLPFVDLTLF
jgi:hypothetical protein